MKAIHIILVFSLGVSLLLGCSTALRRSPTAPDARQTTNDLPPPRLQTVSVSPDALAHFAAGESYFDNDDTADTLKQWEAAALADPSNEQLVVEVSAQLLQDKETQRALAVLRKSAKRMEAAAAVLAMLSQAELQANHPKEALAVSKRAIQRQPDAPDGYECQIEALFQQKQWADASKTLQRAARDVRADPAFLLSLADRYQDYLRNRPKDNEAETRAVELLDRIAQIKFSSSRLWQRLADDYARLNQEKKAAAIYNNLLAQFTEPSLIRDGLHEKLADLYILSDDRTNAMKELRGLIRDNPTHYPRAWFVLGELASEGGDLNEAADDFANALHWDPTIEQAYYDLALVLLDLHRGREAADALAEARARYPKTFSCEFYTGVFHSHLKDYDEAIRHFKEAEIIGLASDPAKLDQRFYFQFGAACERNKQFKEADEYLQKCVNLSPDFAEALNYLGYMLADLGEQLPRARGLIEKAVSLEPTNGAYLDSLGWVLFKLKQPQQALVQLLKAMHYTPEADPTVLDHLGEVYLALHQTDKAVESWKKSLSIESNDDVKRKLQQYSGGL